MKLSVSFLSVKDSISKSIDEINHTTSDFIHLDIMDNVFVGEKTMPINEMANVLVNNKKPLDIHLMVSDIYTYIDMYKDFSPAYITFHYEADTDIIKIINYIKSYNIKVGLSIKPNTDIEVLTPYLNMVDLVLLMSVEPGLGGQAFIDSTSNKIIGLKQLKAITNTNFLIEVDGGINDQTISSCKGSDIVVVGSFITNSDNYQLAINKLKL